MNTMMIMFSDFEEEKGSGLGLEHRSGRKISQHAHEHFEYRGNTIKQESKEFRGLKPRKNYGYKEI